MDTVRKEKTGLYIYIYIALVFTAMLIFFTVLHPVPIMDGDDHGYIIYTRPALPSPTVWNPSRVLPEVLMPLSGNAAGLLTALGLGSFIDCQIFTTALCLSLFITLYVYELYMLLRESCVADRFVAMLLSALFLMLHFLILRSRDSGNRHLFSTYDACTTFFYTISALLNCALVLHLMRKPFKPAEVFGRPSKGSVLILGLYFAVFSNLYGSVFLASYCGVKVLCGLVRSVRARESIAVFMKKNAFFIFIVLLWLLAVLLESQGGRAGSLIGEDNSSGALRATLNNAAALAGETNIAFRLLLLGCIVLTTAVMIFDKDRNAKRELCSKLFVVFAAGAITFFFILMLCIVGNMSTYSGRTDVMFPVLSALIVLMMLCMEYVIKKLRFTASLLPLLLVIVYSFTNTETLTFADSTPMGLNSHTVAAIENDLCEQIIQAVEDGETEMTLTVLQTEDYWANWPQCYGFGEYLCNCLYKYGVIDRPISITEQPSEEYNARFSVKIFE